MDQKSNIQPEILKMLEEKKKVGYGHRKHFIEIQYQEIRPNINKRGLMKLKMLLYSKIKS